MEFHLVRTPLRIARLGSIQIVIVVVRNLWQRLMQKSCSQVAMTSISRSSKTELGLLLQRRIPVDRADRAPILKTPEVPEIIRGIPLRLQMVESTLPSLLLGRTQTPIAAGLSQARLSTLRVKVSLFTSSRPLAEILLTQMDLPRSNRLLVTQSASIP